MLGWFRALMPKEDRFFDLEEPVQGLARRPWPSWSDRSSPRHLEKVMDRFEDAANQISSIVVEPV